MRGWVGFVQLLCSVLRFSDAYLCLNSKLTITLPGKAAHQQSRNFFSESPFHPSISKVA